VFVFFAHNSKPVRIRGSLLLLQTPSVFFQ
jgi:hypothetical protein